MLYGFTKSELSTEECIPLFEPLEALIARDDPTTVVFASLSCQNMYKQGAWARNT
jgi:hypothetical protein